MQIPRHCRVSITFQKIVLGELPEDERRKGGELGLRINPAGVHIHQSLQLQCSKLPIEINDRPNAKQLDILILFE